MINVKETVGHASLRLLSKSNQSPERVVDLQHEMQRKYVDNLIEAAKNGENAFGTKKPFYVCVQTRRERLMQNVIRNQFYPRQTRPIPQYDLALYHYDPKDEKLSFVWCIPDKETTWELASRKVDDDQNQLSYFCECFLNNTLI
jgi:hypothetical protein